MSSHKHAMIAVAVAGALSLGGANAQVPSAASPATPNPTSSVPVQQTPLPASPAPAAPLQNPSATSPLQSPSAAAPLQGPAGATPGTTRMQNQNLAESPIKMPSAIPSRAETAPSAFDKLTAAGSTFVTKEEADRLDGFDRAFSEADRDRDGKLTRDEFNVAWAIYTGRT